VNPPEEADWPSVGLANGRIVAVWGPTGAPGRTALAVTLAAELAKAGTATLLVDADTYGGAIAQVLGLLDEAPGLAAATRAANSGSLDVELFARLAPEVTPHLRVLTGIIRADRWPELRPSALEAVYALSRGIAAVTVVDCGFCLEEDEELAYDTAAPRRNGATLTTLECADVVLAVGSADPVGLQRLVRGLDRLSDLPLRGAPRVVVNRVRRSVVPGDPERELRAALQRYAGVTDPLLVPHDSGALDKALASGRALAEVAPGSPVRAALAPLVAELAGVPAIRPRRLRHRRMGA
jgi:Flp pilus assembly CpaE family ATPase